MRNLQGNRDLEKLGRKADSGGRGRAGEEEGARERELKGSPKPTQHLHGLFVVLVPERGAHSCLAASPPPQLPADEAVEHSEAENREEEEDAGHPHHDGEQSRAHRELRGAALVGVPRVGAVLMLHPDQHEDGPGAAEGHGPDDQDDQLHPALGDHHLGPQREADGEVAFDAQRGDGEHRGVGAALADELEEFAEQVTQVPGPVMPEADEVEGHAEEDEKVGEGHAGQVEVGGGTQLAEARHHQHGEQVARDAHHEQRHAGGCDARQQRRGEERQQLVDQRVVVRRSVPAQVRQREVGPRLLARRRVPHAAGPA